MKYFNNCKTLEELRKEYKRLVKQNHPDNGGSVDEIKIINVEYETALNNLKEADENENAWKYDQEKDELFRDALNKIINLENLGYWQHLQRKRTFKSCRFQVLRKEKSVELARWRKIL